MTTPTNQEDIELDKILDDLDESIKYGEGVDLDYYHSKADLKKELQAIIANKCNEARLKDWQELWEFWVDPLNDDMEVEQEIQDRITELTKGGNNE